MKSLIDRMREGQSQMERRGAKKSIEAEKKPEEEELAELIDKHLADGSKPYTKKRTGFAPSDTNDCARRAVYLFRGITFNPTKDARTLRVFGNGHGFHERISSYFEEMGIVISKEEEISLVDPPIPKAFIDMIIDWHGPTILEFKSIGEDGFAWRKQLNKPKDDHVQQVRIYGRIKQIDRMFIIYENKNTQEILIFKVEQDDEAINKLFDKWRKIVRIVETGNLPKRPVKSIESKKCQYCEVKDLCWSDPDGGI